MTWETFEHDADVGLLVRGRNGPELFAAAGQALFALVCDLEAVRERERFELAGTADGIEALLVDWLNDLVFLFQGEDVVCRQFAFPLWTETAYRAEAYGEAADPERHGLRDLVKAATYHRLAVRRSEMGLEARVILDV